MYAIFRAQGKQFRAVRDRTLRIPTLDAEPGEKVTFDEVLLTEREGDVRVGTPTLTGAKVAAEVVGHGRGEKIIVYKMKRRKGYRRKQGHRQGYTEIRIVEISFPTGKKKPIAKPRPEPEEAKAEEAPAEEYDITPAALALAEEHGIDLAGIEGTGKDGRILKGDVDRAIKEREEG